MSCLPKPILRGHIKKKGLKAIVGAVAFSVFNVCMWKLFFIMPKAKKFEEFMQNYDAKAHSRDLIEWGYFQTVRPEDLKTVEE